MKPYSILLFYFCMTAATISFAQQEAAPSPEAEINQLTQGSLANQEQTNAESAPIAETAPIMEIKPLDEKSEKPLYSFELRDVAIGDLFRVLAHDYKLNLLVDKEVSGTVTASLSNVTLDEALNTIAESQNLILIKKDNIIRVRLNLLAKTFTLKYIEANKVLGSSSSSESSSPTASAGTQNTIYDLLSEKGKVLLGAQPNSLVVIDYPPNIARIEEYLNEIDKRTASRVFKLKYLKAVDVVGQNTSSSTSSSEGYSASTTSSPSSSSTETTASSTSSTGGS